MSHYDHAARPSKPKASFLTSRAGITFWILLAIAAFLLFAEHRAHVLGISFFVLLVACPLLHIFMHSGHSGRDGHESGSPSRGGRDRGGA